SRSCAHLDSHSRARIVRKRGISGEAPVTAAAVLTATGNFLGMAPRCPARRGHCSSLRGRPGNWAASTPLVTVAAGRRPTGPQVPAVSVSSDSQRRSQLTSAWVRPIVLAVSCLILGFVAGWVLHGSSDNTTALPSASVDTTVTQPPPRTTSVPTEVPPPPRSQVSLLVLNGTGQAGLAARTAARAGPLRSPNPRPTAP